MHTHIVPSLSSPLQRRRRPPNPFPSQAYYVWVYAIFAGVILLVSIGRSWLFFVVAVRASNKVHGMMAHRVRGVGGGGLWMGTGVGGRG